MTELLVPSDPVLPVTDLVYDLIHKLPELEGFRVGTHVEDGVSPEYFIQVRSLGGSENDRVADRTRLDLRVWTDGSYADEARALRIGRLLLAHIRRSLPGCRVFASPAAFPDPADPEKTHVLFTVELLLKRGTHG